MARTSHNIRFDDADWAAALVKAGEGKLAGVVRGWLHDWVTGGDPPGDGSAPAGDGPQTEHLPFPSSG